MRRSRLGLAVAVTALCTGTVRSQDLTTLNDALALAKTANASLPAPRLDVAAAGEKLAEERARRWATFALQGTFIYAPPGYDVPLTNLGQGLLEVVAHQPIWAGGEIAASIDRADAAAAKAGARYRMAEKDVVLGVTGAYCDLMAARSVEAIHRAGVSRLHGYARALRARERQRPALSPDLVKIQVRLAIEESAAVDAELRAQEDLAELNTLMGRHPSTPLEPVSLPEPDAPESGVGAWQSSPEVAEAEAVVGEARADEAVAGAAARPRISFDGTAGFWVSDTTHLGSEFWDRFWNSRGYSLGLSVVWPLWDAGVIEARRAQARLERESAQARLDAATQRARLAWWKAAQSLGLLARQFRIVSAAAPEAIDALFETEGRYAESGATALEVLDAFDSAIALVLSRHELTARFHIAEALAARWGSP